MIRRECPECSSELVRARRSTTDLVSGTAPLPSPAWRCGVCGRVFTVDQIRESQRAKSTAIER